jgi:cytoskeletal protein RodZ
MAKSIGKQLYESRIARGLSIEDVQHKTRIPAPRLQEMENDDYSNFANLTYAKGFLALYSKYLKLDIQDYLSEFQTDGLSSVEGYSYLQNTAGRVPPPQMLDKRPSRWPLALIVTIFGLIIGGVIAFNWWQNRPAPSVPNDPSSESAQPNSGAATAPMDPISAPEPVPTATTTAPDSSTAAVESPAATLDPAPTTDLPIQRAQPAYEVKRAVDAPR